MPWSMDVLSLAGATTVSDAPFKSARVTWAADGVGAAEISLRSPDVTAGALRAGQKRIAFRDGAGTRRYQGWLDLVERAGRPSDIRFRGSSRGLSSVLDQRVVHGDFSKESVAAPTIAWNLIQHAQAQTDGDHGFTLGTITGSPTNRTRHYCDGDIISEQIRELSEMDTGGFWWEIDADGAFNAWVDGRGTDVSGSVTLAPSDAIDWSCKEDLTEFATYCTGLGDFNDDQPCGAPLIVDFVSERTTYGRREVVIEGDTNDAGEMEQKTTEELRARVASRFNLRTDWVEGQGPWSFGTRWLGDIVTAALGSEFGGNTTVRLIGITITLEPGLHEFVQYEWEKA